MSMVVFDFSNLTEEQQDFVGKLEAMGEAAVAATVVSEIWAQKRTLAIAWLESKKKERELEAWRAAIDASHASKISIEVAAQSSKATERSAKWTKYAAIATAIAAIGTCVQAFLQYSHS
jgi:hypothetical protein